jgi:SAM-dependent methyltransferase
MRRRPRSNDGLAARGYYHSAAVAEAYDREHHGQAITTQDVPFYVELAVEAAAGGQEVLELGCGTGRVTLPVAAAGVSITGVDASPQMLAVARRMAGGAPNPRWIEADMARFDLGRRFGLVIVPFRSFQMLLTVEDQASCLACIGRHLAAGGRLALNVANPAPALLAAASGRRSAAETESAGRNGLFGRPARNLRWRYVSREEMEKLLTANGFETEGVYGWFDRRDFTFESSELVLVARRKKRRAD